MSEKAFGMLIPTAEKTSTDGRFFFVYSCGGLLIRVIFDRIEFYGFLNLFSIFCVEVFWFLC